MTTTTSTAVNIRNSNGDKPTPRSRYQATFTLADWWLAKAEDDTQGTILAVAGHTDTVAGTQPMRFFSSLPILERHDVFTLETTDGKCVILKGFLNKARTEENGFPSILCNHFMYGFPQYWKECTEKYMVKEPSSDILPPKYGSVISDSGKKSNKINILDGVDKIDKEDSQVHDSPLKAKFGRGMISSEEMSSHTKNKARTCSMSRLEMKQKNGQEALVVLSGSEKIRLNSVSLSLDFDKVELPCEESNLGGKNEDNTRLNESNDGKINSSETSNLENDLKRVQTRGLVKQKAKSKAATPLSKPVTADGEKINNLNWIDNINTKDSQVHDSPLKAKFGRGMNSSEEISSHTKSKARTSLMGRLEMKQRNGQASVVVSRDEKIRSSYVSLSLDFDKVELACGESNLDGKNDLHVEDHTRLNESNNDKKNSSETSNLEKGLKRVQTRGSVKQKAKSKAATPLSKPVTADDEKCSAVSDRKSLSENAKAPYMRRKLAYETPKREKKKAPVESLQSSNFKRSRSGRMLMPKLEFWRNQRAIYGADGTVTGIKEDVQLEQPIKGSGSTAQRKRRRL